MKIPRWIARRWRNFQRLLDEDEAMELAEQVVQLVAARQWEEAATTEHRLNVLQKRLGYAITDYTTREYRKAHDLD